MCDDTHIEFNQSILGQLWGNFRQLCARNLSFLRVNHERPKVNLVTIRTSTTIAVDQIGTVHEEGTISPVHYWTANNFELKKSF